MSSRPEIASDMPVLILEFLKLPELSERAVVIFASAKMVAALLACFCGYRFVKSFAALTGFLLGSAFAWGATFTLKDLSIPGRLAITLAFGFILSVLAFRLYHLGLWLFIGSACANMMAAAIFPPGRVWEVLHFGCTIAVFLATGYLANHFLKPFIILATAVSGAALAVIVLPELYKNPLLDLRIQFFVFLGLAVFGLLTQFVTAGKK